MKTSLSDTAFWDIEMATLDINKHSDFIVARVFQYGLFNDVRFVIKTFSKEQINKALKNQRKIDGITKEFAKALGFLGDE